MVSPEIIDLVSRVAPLGLRFWDSVTNSFISEGLHVTAVPKIVGASSIHPVEAFVNRSDVFVFHHLPGLTFAENGRGNDPYWQTPPVQKDFIVGVRDTRERFLPFTVSVKAPTRKLLVWSCPGGKPTPNLPLQPVGAIPLFSSAGRPVPGGMAVIRTTIVTNSGDPAAWAMLEAKCDTKLMARGIADQRGRVALYFPYPKFLPVAKGKDTPPLTAQSWPIDLTVFFSPGPPIANIPDLCSTLSDQAKAHPLKKLSPSTALGKVTLKYAEELIVKTQSKSELFLK